MNLEDFIRKHRTAFDEGTIPEELQMRISSKIAGAAPSGSRKSNKGNAVKIITYAVSFAALVILSITVTTNVKNRETGISAEYDEYQALIKEIQNMGENEDNAILMMEVANITEETPIEEEIPEGLSKQERLRIIKKYYGRKTEGLKRIKVLLATNNENLED